MLPLCHRGPQFAGEITEYFILCHLFLPFIILDILVILVQTVTYLILQMWLKKLGVSPTIKFFF